jgi:hypothetical protein
MRLRRRVLPSCRPSCKKWCSPSTSSATGAAFGEYYGVRVVVEDYATVQEARLAVGPFTRIRRCLDAGRCREPEVPPELFAEAVPSVAYLLMDTFRDIMREQVLNLSLIQGLPAAR